MPSRSPRRPASGFPEEPEPAGFGNCGQCAYKFAGSVETCYRCARSTLDRLTSDRCDTCEGELKADGTCGNPLCNRTVDARGWEFIWAISTRTGALKEAIDAYKYSDKWGWGHIFGRVLVGYLAGHEELFRTYDIVMPMPTFVGPGGRVRDHTAFVVERAQVEDPSWPFRFDVMTKTAATPRLANYRTFAERLLIAETEVGPALEVVDPATVSGKSVLVFDDVFTAGLTLRQVALKLRAAGATEVAGLVLARQPFRG